MSALRERSPEGSSAPPADAPPGSWAALTGHAGASPFVRLPVGVAAVVVVGAIGLVVLAYFVGESRGYRRGRDEMQLQLLAPAAPVRYGEEAAQMGVPSPSPAGSPSPVAPKATEAAQAKPKASSKPTIDASLGPVQVQPRPISPSQFPEPPPKPAAVQVVTVTQSPKDPREAGKHYYVLAHTTEEHAAKMVAFLEQEGVAAAGIKGNNTRLYKVVALRGYAGAELESDGFKDFRKQLQKLGRAFASKGEGKAWDDLFYSRYDGAPCASVIVRKSEL